MTEIKLPKLSPDEARRIDQICDRYETARRAGQRPDVSDYLNGVAEPVRSALLRYLLQLDLEYQRQSGIKPQASDYATKFPNDTALINEVCLEAGKRRERGMGTYPLIRTANPGIRICGKWATAASA